MILELRLRLLWLAGEIRAAGDGEAAGAPTFSIHITTNR